MSGELLRQFEDYYDKGLFLRQPSVEAWASLQYLLFREGSSGVVLGKGRLAVQQRGIPRSRRLPAGAGGAPVAHRRGGKDPQGAQQAADPAAAAAQAGCLRGYASRAPDARAKALYDDFPSVACARSASRVALRGGLPRTEGAAAAVPAHRHHWTPYGARLAARSWPASTRSWSAARPTPRARWRRRSCRAISATICSSTAAGAGTLPAEPAAGVRDTPKTEQQASDGRCSARPPSRSCWSAPATPRSTGTSRLPQGVPAHRPADHGRGSQGAVPRHGAVPCRAEAGRPGDHHGDLGIPRCARRWRKNP